MDRALRPLRPRPFAFVTGLLGVTALVISFALAVRTPRPSTVPIDEPFAEIECGELDASIARTRAQGYTSRVRVRGALRRHRRTRAVYLLCGERAVPLSVAGGADMTRAGLLLRITTHGRLVIPRASIPPPSPRGAAKSAAAQGMAAGVLGTLLILVAWSSRPFDPLRDLVGREARAEHQWWSAPSNDRVVVDGEELAHAALVVRDGRLSPGAAEGAHLGLPGAESRYRERAGGPPYVQGPAEVNGLPVPAGRRVPFTHGDRVTLDGLTFSPSLARPGVLIRYLLNDGAIEWALRVRDRWARHLTSLAFVLGGVGAALLHVDAPVRWLLAAPLLVGWAIATYSVPAARSRRLAQRFDVDDVRAGRVRFELSDEGSEGRGVYVGDRLVGRLPPPATEMDRLSARRALCEALDREVKILSECVSRPA
ncbi:MAG: hypothetical protein EVA89_06165 [Sandaracinaceae bacterium]|nr:MAG: hypothetical protein EVA89_06165 [Sandaracinaceae bacterium]